MVKDRDIARVFLGKDVATFGEEGTGWIDYDPDYECGGPMGTRGRQCPHLLSEEEAFGRPLQGTEDRLLHLSIASYRDPLCPRTLYNLFNKAKNPESIRVRVLQQNDPTADTPCLEEYCKLMAKENNDDNKKKKKNNANAPIICPFEDQIHIHEIHAKEAAGPTWARSLLSKDIADEYNKGHVHTQDFCMSTDSHMDFEPNWDESMIHMWDMVENEYAVLSTYVASTDQLGINLNGVHEVPHLCMITFTSQVRTHGTKCARMLPKPKLTNAIWGAGLSFSKCHAELKVPVDPHTPHIFDGEEFNRAARFWTYGYDIYTPHRVYVLHDYHKSQSNPIMSTWTRNHGKHGDIATSHERLHAMVGMDREIDSPDDIALRQTKYGLGDRRSLEQLIQFSGIDLRHRKFPLDSFNRCGNIRWVTFEEHPRGVNYIPKFDDETEKPLDLPYDETSVWYDPGAVVHGMDTNRKLPKEGEGGGGEGDELDESDLSPPMIDLDMAKIHGALKEEMEQQQDGINSKNNNNNDDAHIHPASLVDMHEKHAELQKEIEKEMETERKNAEPIISNAEAAAMKMASLSKLNDGTGIDGGMTIKKDDPKNTISNPLSMMIRGAKLTAEMGGPNSIGNTKQQQQQQQKHHSIKKNHGLLVDGNHRPPNQHGAAYLPLPVQIAAVILTLGIIVAIVMPSKKHSYDKSGKKKRKKRAL